MTYTRRHARPLLNEAEFELFLASLSDRITDHDRKALGTLISRTRRARDKARDLYQRQTIKTKKASGARGSAGTANQRTAAKQQALAEALDRLEARAEQLDAAADRAARQGALDAKATGTGPNRAARRAAKGSAKAASGFMSDSAAAEAKVSRRAPQTRITASRAAAGRRSQAKRDAR
jgi:hypothetical protein